MAIDDTLEPGALQPVVPTPTVGTNDGLEAFVVEHYDRLLRLARLVCYDVTEAGDAVQSGLEQAWRHRGGLRDAERQRAWLDRIVVREAIKISRRRRTWLERILGLEHAVDLSPQGPDITPSLALRAALGDAFRQLPPEQRAAVALHLYAGYTVAETADLVGAPVETVRSRLRVARERLRTHLGEVLP